MPDHDPRSAPTHRPSSVRPSPVHPLTARPLRGARPARASAVAAATLALLAASVLAPDAPTASADGQVCGEFDLSPIDGGLYNVQNNRFGVADEQCVSARAGGFTVDQADGEIAPGGPPKSYPSIVAGCHWGRCTDAPGLPVQASQVGGARTSVSITRAPGSWNAAYDLWFNSSPESEVQNDGTEIMIWIDAQDAPSPIGEVVGTVEVDGASWQVWQGNIGWDVVSFVREQGATSVDLALEPFVQESIARGATEPDDWLTSVQFGFEPWSGGEGLAASAFSWRPDGGAAGPGGGEAGQDDGDGEVLPDGGDDQGRDDPGPPDQDDGDGDGDATDSDGTPGGDTLVTLGEEGEDRDRTVPAQPSGGSSSGAGSPSAPAPAPPAPSSALPGPAPSSSPVLPSPPPSPVLPSPPPSSTAPPAPPANRTSPAPPAQQAPAPAPAQPSAPRRAPAVDDALLVHGPTGLCLDARGAGTVGDPQVALWTCDASQAWTPTGGSLVHRWTGACLGTAAGARSAGTAAQLQVCDGHPGQSWRVTRAGALANTASGLCLGAGGGTREGAPVGLVRCAGAPTWS